MKKQIFIFPLALSFLFLSGCGEDPVATLYDDVREEKDSVRRGALCEMIDQFKLFKEGKRFAANEALCGAVIFEYPEHARICIEEGANVNFRGDGHPLLEIAARRNHNLEFTAMLLDNGADPNVLCHDDVPLLLSLIQSKIIPPAKLGAIKTDEKGWKIFTDTETRGNLIGLLVERGASVEAGRGNLTPLGAAVQQGDLRIAELLLRNGALAESETDRTPRMCVAAEKGNIEMAKLLLEHGASPHGKGVPDAPMVSAIREKKYTFVDFLISRGCDVRNPELLGYFSEGGNLDAVTFLLSRKSDPNATCGNEAIIALAAAGGHVPVVKALIDAGGNVNPALPYFVESQNLEVCKYLIARKANPNLNSLSGSALVVRAMELQNRELVKLLVSAGANATSVLPNYVVNSDAEMVEFLLEHKAIPNLKIGGRTLVQIAFENGDLGILKRLVAAGAGATEVFPAFVAMNDIETVEFIRVHDVNLVLPETVTPVVIDAARNKSFPNVKALVESGANPTLVLPYYVRARDRDAVSYLLTKNADPNVRIGKVPIVAFAARYSELPIVRLLVNAGADATVALPYFVEKKNLEGVSFLLEKNADPNSFYDEKHIVAVAAETGHVPVVKALISAGGEATPALPYFIKKRNTEVVSYLLKQNADPNYRYEEEPVVLLAARKDCIAIVKALVEAGANATDALLYYVLKEDLPTITYLLGHKADPNVKLGVVPAVVLAAGKKNENIVKRLTNAGANATYALPFFLLPKDTSMVNYLLKKNADPNTVSGVFDSYNFEIVVGNSSSKSKAAESED